MIEFVAKHAMYEWSLGEEFFARIYLCQCDVNSSATIRFTNLETGKLFYKADIANGVTKYLLEFPLTEKGKFEINVTQSDEKSEPDIADIVVR